jgi:hypothetical protein
MAATCRRGVRDIAIGTGTPYSRRCLYVEKQGVRARCPLCNANETSPRCSDATAFESNRSSLRRSDELILSEMI